MIFVIRYFFLFALIFISSVVAPRTETHPIPYFKPTSQTPSSPSSQKTFLLELEMELIDLIYMLLLFYISQLNEMATYHMLNLNFPGEEKRERAVRKEKHERAKQKKKKTSKIQHQEDIYSKKKKRKRGGFSFVVAPVVFFFGSLDVYISGRWSNTLWIRFRCKLIFFHPSLFRPFFSLLFSPFPFTAHIFQTATVLLPLLTTCSFSHNHSCVRWYGGEFS